jgi:hypothetical protein
MQPARQLERRRRRAPASPRRFLRQLLGYGQRAGALAEVREGGLQMERGRVIDRAADLRLLQRRTDAVAFGRATDEEVIHVSGLVLGQLARLAQPQLRIPRGSLATRSNPPVELAEEDAQHRCLDLVEARVVTDHLEVDLVARAVEPQHPHALRELVVARRHEPAVPDAEEVLRRIEAERGRDTRPADVRRAECLRRVLDHRRPQLHELRERRRTAEEMDGEDRFGALGDPRSDILGVEIHRRRVHVGEDGRRPTPRNRLGSRVERERRADHLVTRSDAERVEHEHERIGAVGDADGVFHAEIAGGLALERSNVGAEDEIAALEHAVDRLANARNERSVLRFYVNERDRTHDRRV